MSDAAHLFMCLLAICEDMGFSMLKPGKKWEKQDKVGTLLDIHKILMFSVVEGETLGYSFINTF